MGKIIVIILGMLMAMIVYSLPLYVAANFVAWIFHLSFHITLLQAFAISLLGTVIHRILFKDKEKS